MFNHNYFKQKNYKGEIVFKHRMYVCDEKEKLALLVCVEK